MCLLRDLWAGEEDPDFMQNLHDEWSHLFMDRTGREEVFEGGTVYRRADHRGIWILEGDRSRGLNVCLKEGLSDMNGSIVALQRDTSRTRPH